MLEGSFPTIRLASAAWNRWLRSAIACALFDSCLDGEEGDIGELLCDPLTIAWLAAVLPGLPGPGVLVTASGGKTIVMRNQGSAFACETQSQNHTVFKIGSKKRRKETISSLMGRPRRDVFSPGKTGKTRITLARVDFCLGTRGKSNTSRTNSSFPREYYRFW